MMVCAMNEIYIKYIWKRRNKWTGMEPETVDIVAQVSQLTFTYLLWLPITPDWP